ncbi:MAG: serine hydrolase, partial [Pseudomonadota bacterium]
MIKHSLKTAAAAVVALVIVQGTAQSAGFETAAKQAIIVDYATGAELFGKNADEIMEPASMTKMMTVYMLFERLKEGSLKLEDTFLVSEKAWRKKGSKMFVPVGGRVSVEDLVRGIIVQSGNDASIVVAEGLAGSEEAFADQMTAKAREIGMTNTTFRNASGWPDPGHTTTAR